MSNSVFPSVQGPITVFLLCCAFAAGLAVNALAQTMPISWAISGGGGDDDFGWSVAVDAEGNCYATGHFSEEALLGGDLFQSRGSYDIYLMKLSPKGVPLWVIQAGGPDFDDGRSVAVDSNGKVYLTGYFSDTADFGGRSLTAVGQKDLFLACYDPQGKLLWVTQAGGLGDDLGMGVAVDADHNIYVTGGFSSTFAFGSSVLTSAGQHDVLLAKYSPGGSLIWTRQAGGPEVDEGQRVAVDRLGNIYITGQYGTNAVFETTSPPSRGSSDIFLAKYDRNGALLWLRTAGGAESDHGYDVATDSSLNVCVVGSITGRAIFENAAVSAGGVSDIFAAKYGPDGDLKWVSAYGGSGSDEGNALGVDATGNVYVSGYYINSVSFGRITYNAPSHADFLVFKLDPDGRLVWSAAAQGTAYSNPHGLAVTPEGAVFATGYFRGPTQFGGIHLSNQGDRDMWVAKIEAQPRLDVSHSKEGAIVRWPADLPQFQLEQNGAFNSTGRWTAVSGTVTTTGDFNVLTNRALAPAQFFRLRSAQGSGL